MHIAAAAGTPTIAVFGPTSESRFAPRGDQVEVVSRHLPCSPDEEGTLIDRCQSCIYPVNRCLTELSHAPVVSAAQRLLRRRQRLPQ
jgi:ADP-heptose:LPS heptosyltransferase